MASQENLRDRIAAVMYCHKHPLARMEDALRMARGEGMDSKRGQTNVVQRQYLPWAQAIIDEFQLTIEPHCEECEHKVIEGWWEKK